MTTPGPVPDKVAQLPITVGRCHFGAITRIGIVTALLPSSCVLAAEHSGPHRRFGLWPEPIFLAGTTALQEARRLLEQRTSGSVISGGSKKMSHVLVGQPLVSAQIIVVGRRLRADGKESMIVLRAFAEPAESGGPVHVGSVQRVLACSLSFANIMRSFMSVKRVGHDVSARVVAGHAHRGHAVYRVPAAEPDDRAVVPQSTALSTGDIACSES